MEKSHGIIACHSKHKQRLIRLTFYAFLIAAAASVGYFTYDGIRMAEESDFETEYDNNVKQMYNNIILSMRQKMSLMRSTAIIYSAQCPYTAMWPNCSLPYDVFQNLVDPIARAEIVSIRSLNVAPIVVPSKRSQFESYVQKYLEKEKEMGVIPEGYGSHSFGTGVILTMNSSSRVYDSGIFKSSRQLFIPAINVVDPFLFMLNLYSLPQHFDFINKVLDNCHSVMSVSSPFFSLPTDCLTRPIASFYVAIIPRLDPMDTAVGIVQLIHEWDLSILSAVPSLNTELTLLVTATVNSTTGPTSTTYTFTIQNGPVVQYEAGATTPSRSYIRKYRQHFDVLPQDQYCAGCDVYSFTFYPTQSGYDEYFSDTPIILSVAASAVTLLLGFFFFMYDRSVVMERRRQAALLDSKRMFVRFISHEIRTPLNTSILGLDILGSEIALALEREKSENSLFVTRTKEWLGLVEEISGSSSTAVVVLNDLIDYDKIESTTYSIEKKLIPAESFLLKALHTVLPDQNGSKTKYTIQSGPTLISASDDCSSLDDCRRADVICIVDGDRDLHLDHSTGENYSDIGKSSGDVISKLTGNHCILGDSFKVGQVIRNVISNALKFSNDKPIKTKVLWLPNGLPDFKIERYLTKRQKDGKMPVICDTVQLQNSDKSIRLADLQPDGSVLVECTDFGPGMSPEQLLQLFGEGVQFSPNELQAGGGSGLGLWISKGLVELHEGRIYAKSAGLGKGSTFCIELPVVKLVGGLESGLFKGIEESDININLSYSSGGVRTRALPRVHELNEVAKTDNSESSSNQTSNDLVPPASFTTPNANLIENRRNVEQTESKNKGISSLVRALVVDDVPSTRKMVMRLLKLHGVSCLEAGDGQAALQVLKKACIDADSTPNACIDDAPVQLVLMDAEMPIMKGPQAIEAMRKLGYTNTVMIGVSGNVLPEDVKVFLDCGADAVLAKPLQINKLSEVIKSLLAGRN